MCENRIQTFIFNVVYVSETGRIGGTCAGYDKFTDLTLVHYFFSLRDIFLN